MQSGLHNYADYVKGRNEMADYMKMIDPRSDEEKMTAADLQSLAKSNNELTNYEKGECWGLKNL